MYDDTVILKRQNPIEQVCLQLKYLLDKMLEILRSQISCKKFLKETPQPSHESLEYEAQWERELRWHSNLKGLLLSVIVMKYKAVV